ncbi:MAG: glycosyltransferase, partial [Planctomycetota bacterium]
MRIGLYHNWELRGSGSNEYSRYLAAALNQAGHEVHVICREPEPERIDSISRIVTWDLDGRPVSRRPGRKTTGAPLVLHVLPVGDVAPVYVTDKQREGPVKAFVHLSDAELDGYLRSTTRVLAAILATTRLDVLHVNHVVPQPSVAADACRDLGIPFVIYPHGSAIEYAVRRDERYRRMASDAIGRAAGLIIGSREVMNRLLELCPERRDRIASRTKIIGVGVDTSLFTPVARGERETAVARLIAKAPGGGKSGDLVDELRRRLDRGDLEAVRDYRDAYPHDLPDADVAARLKRLPFSDGRILLFVGALTVGKGLQRVIVALPGILAEVPDAHLVIVGSGAYREVLEGLVHAIASGNEALLDALVAKGNDLDDTHLEGPWEAVAEYLSAPGNRRTVLSA